MPTVFLTSGTSYTIPADWSATNTIECIGGGGGGATGNASTNGGGGGEGGGYSKITNIAGLTPSGSVTVQVGAAGSANGGSGTDTFFNGASLGASSVGAKGGAGGTIGTGGSGSNNAGNGVGTTKVNGGTGGNAVAGWQGAGGGGGAGGPNGAGKNGGSNLTGHAAGGGGGGNGNGSNGSNSASLLVGGAGGNGNGGTGGGAGGSSGNASNATATTGGGGGGGGNAGTGGNAAAGSEFDSTHGSGGGGGGGGGGSGTPDNDGGNAGSYGGGGGGGGGCSTGTPGAGRAGAAGLIVIVYTSAASLAAGTASLSSKGPTTASLTCGVATGGTAPYTYQWKRKLVGGSYSNVSGATSLTLNDTGLTDATAYTYKLTATDNVSATADSNEITLRTDVAPNNAVIHRSPENWGTVSASNARCNIQGGYTSIPVTVAGTEDVSITFDTSRLNGLSAGSTPTVACEMDGLLLDLNSDGLFYKQLTNAANTQTITLKASPANGRHVFRLSVRSFAQISGTTPGPWGASGNPPPGCVDITSWTIGTTSTLDTLTSGTDYYTDTAVFVGDSITVGVLAALASGSTTSTTSAANNDTRKAWPLLLRNRLKCEIGVVAQGGLGYTTQSGTFQGSSTANPGADTANGAGETFLSHHWNGNPRTWLTTHKYIINQLGVNDGGSLTTTVITNVLTYERAQCGSTPWLLQLVEPAQRGRATTTSALATPQDSKTKLLDYVAALYGTSAGSTVSPDGSHMNSEGHARWAAVVAGLTQAVVGGTGGGPLLSQF